MEEIPIDAINIINDANYPAVNNDHNINPDEIDRFKYKATIAIIICRTIILIPFIICNFYFWIQPSNSCDYGLTWFLFVDGLLGSIRLFDPIVFFVTTSYKYFEIERIIYNVTVFIWIISGLIYSIINVSCEKRDQHTSTYYFFWLSIIASLLYRLLVFIIPMIFAFGINCYNKHKKNKIVNFISKLSPLSFIDGTLIDSVGNIVKNLDKYDDKCMICLTDYGESSNEKIIKLNCGHHFHEECNKAWLKDHITCPYCKQKIIYKI